MLNYVEFPELSFGFVAKTCKAFHFFIVLKLAPSLIILTMCHAPCHIRTGTEAVEAPT